MWQMTKFVYENKSKVRLTCVRQEVFYRRLGSSPKIYPCYLRIKLVFYTNFFIILNGIGGFNLEKEKLLAEIERLTSYAKNTK